MLIRLVIAFIVASGVYAGLRILLRKKPLSVGQFFQIYVAVLVGLVLLYLGLTGRLHPLFALLGAFLPFIGRLLSWLPRGLQLYGIMRQLRGFMPYGSSGPATSQGQMSEINTRFLHMVLFHDTGMMDGEVLEGSLQGAKLSLLELADLLTLRSECRSDGDSVSILEAYLDREHEQWRDQTSDSEDPGPGSHDDTNLSAAQAYEILGLDPDATKDDIVQAHRRLMQKMHPDRGGSTYLAARINAAKDVLLDLLDGR